MVKQLFTMTGEGKSSRTYAFAIFERFVIINFSSFGIEVGYNVVHRGPPNLLGS